MVLARAQVERLDVMGEAERPSPPNLLATVAGNLFDLCPF